MAFQLNCPCGVMIAELDDSFLNAVRNHLTAEHPGRSYTDNEIMMLALPAPDRVVRSTVSPHNPSKT